MKITLENKQEVIDAVNAGKQVFCSNEDYKVIKDKLGQYLIEYRNGSHYVGLSGKEGTKYENTLNLSDHYYFEEPDSERSLFFLYCNKFYNKVDGIYPIASSWQIVKAIQELESVNKSNQLRGMQYDSLDREILRTILQPNYSIF